eukprot:5974274-Prymnesium_polylepis.1
MRDRRPAAWVESRTILAFRLVGTRHILPDAFTVARRLCGTPHLGEKKCILSSRPFDNELLGKLLDPLQDARRGATT